MHPLQRPTWFDLEVPSMDIINRRLQITQIYEYMKPRLKLGATRQSIRGVLGAPSELSWSSKSMLGITHRAIDLGSTTEHYSLKRLQVA